MFQHNKSALDCKGKEPDVLFLGNVMVQLMQQNEIWQELLSLFPALKLDLRVIQDMLCGD